MEAVMRKGAKILAAAAGLSVTFALGGCADSNFWTTDPLSWWTSSQDQPAPPTTTQAQAAVATPQPRPAPNQARTAAAKKQKGQPASTQAQAQPERAQAQASAVTPVAPAKPVDEPTYIKVQDIGIQENIGPH
jgi:hypothetical protein